MIQVVKADWIAVDWGTTHLRAYAMRGGVQTGQATSSNGMATLSPDQFETVLETTVADWETPANATVIACGMVGSRQGWVEAPYRTVPCPPLAAALTRTPTRNGRLQVHVISGLSQAEPPDVMRGEETQIAGFLSLNPNWDGVICLPGTHTKWTQISAGEVVSFQTFMTGEIFALLSRSSVLRHSVAHEGWDPPAFDQAVDDALSKPERLAARLFGLRAADLLRNTDATTTRASLSGYLIGAELAAARPYWLGQSVAVLGSAEPAEAYARALGQQGTPVTIVDSDQMTLAGLCAAHWMLKGQT